MTLTIAAVTAGLAVSVGVAAVTLVALFGLALKLIDRESGTEGPDDEPGPGGGGGNDRIGPITGGGGGDPAWWPEFERELERYAAGRDNAGVRTGVSA